MIVVLAASYLAIGVVLAGVAARRRGRAVELASLLVAWPLYAPLWLERPASALDRAAVVDAALARLGDRPVVATLAAAASRAAARPAGAPGTVGARVVAGVAAATAALAALDRALATHAGTTTADSPSLRRGQVERARRQAALAAVDALFVELTAQVDLAAWIAGVDAELERLVAALAAALVDLAPASTAE